MDSEIKVQYLGYDSVRRRETFWCEPHPNMVFKNIMNDIAGGKVGIVGVFYPQRGNTNAELVFEPGVNHQAIAIDWMQAVNARVDSLAELNPDFTASLYADDSKAGRAVDSPVGSSGSYNE